MPAKVEPGITAHEQEASDRQQGGKKIAPLRLPGPAKHGEKDLSSDKGYCQQPYSNNTTRNAGWLGWRATQKPKHPGCSYHADGCQNGVHPPRQGALQPAEIAPEAGEG